MGCADFIGHVTRYLLDRSERVMGVDDLNAYYDVTLKQARLAQLQGRARFEFHQIDVADPTAMTGLAEQPFRYRHDHSSRGAGRCALLADAAEEPCLRELILGLRRQHEAAVQRRRAG
jgi:nucleoside-diphosphate-sugar epimerase